MRTITVLLLILVITAISLIFLLPRLLPPAPAVVVHSQGPTIERLERLSHLVTTKVYIADVLVGEGEGSRGAWLIKGDALIAVNLGRARITEKNDATKQALIVLPPPEILQPRVDHERTKTWEVRRMTWLPWNADQDQLRDEVMRQAQQLVAQAAGSDENVQQAKTTAATIVKAFYEEVGWNVRVTWEGESADGKQGSFSPRPAMEAPEGRTRSLAWSRISGGPVKSSASTGFGSESSTGDRPIRRPELSGYWVTGVITRRPQVS